MTADEISATKKFVNQSSDILSGTTGDIQTEVKKLSTIASKTLEIIQLSAEIDEFQKQITSENSTAMETDNVLKGFQAKKAALLKKKEAFYKVKGLFEQFMEIVNLLSNSELKTRCNLQGN